MSEPIKINFAKQAYQSRSMPLNAQRCVNFYLEPAPEDSKEPDVLFSTPGLKLWASISSVPIYGMHVLGSYLYVVTDNKVYRVDTASSASSLGSIGTTENVVMMDNNADDVIIVKEDGASYLADSASLTQITDGDFVSASSVAAVDGYACFSRISSNTFHISDLNDASAYAAADTSEIQQNSNTIVRAIAHQGGLWLFTSGNIEVWYNSGNADFPFVPNRSATISRGCAAKRSVVQEDNTLFFLGDDRIIYRMDGYTPKRISTHAIEKAIQGYTTISDCEAIAYTQEGHKFAVFTFPTELETWVYDISTGLWHQRQSFGEGRWRASSHAFFAGKHLVGDFETGKIYELDLDTYTDNTTTIQGVLVSPPIYSGNKRITHDRLWIEFDTGVGLITGQGSDPLCMLRFSDDAGNTWSNEIQASIGDMGDYRVKVEFTCLGQSRHRIYELKITDPIKRHITGAWLNMRVGKA